MRVPPTAVPPGAAPVPGIEAERSPAVAGGMALGWALALAAAAGAGAWAAAPVPVGAGAGPALLGWWLRRPVLLVVGVGLLGSALGARAVDGLEPARPGPFDGTVELVTDPEPAGPAGWRAEVRLPDGRRVRAGAHGGPGRSLAAAHAGSRITVTGRLGPLAHRSAWTDSRHLVGSLTVERAGRHTGGSALSRAAQVVRRAVDAGAQPVPERLRPLYTGLVVGDDRFQPPAQQASFRAAGLTHLLAVSGQNVAFVLLVAGPVLRRLGTWPRFVAVAAVLVLFATVTRFEPSVLRATATAGIAAWSVALGRPNRGVRVLALAVTALVLVDPLLVRSIGFQLSVLASAGILVLGPPLDRIVPGPGWIREPLVVTASAQLAVLPVLAAVFGPVSLAAVPANLAVSAAAGLVMTWGLTVGIVAGAVPAPLGQVVQLPAAWSLQWIDTVARLAATAPAPRVGTWAVVPAAAIAAWLLWAPARRHLAAVAVAAVLLLAPATGGGTRSLPGARWCSGGTVGWDVLVLDDAGRLPALLEAVLERGIGRVDVVLATRGGRAYGEAVRQLGEIAALGPVLAPPQHQIRGARRVTDPLQIPGGSGTITVEPDGPDALNVTGACRGGDGQRTIRVGGR